MILQQISPSGSPVQNYPSGPSGWSLLVANNVIVDGVPIAIGLPGVFFLAAGDYDVQGSVLGIGGQPCMAALALTSHGISFDFSAVILQSQSVTNNGDPLFFGSVTIPTSEAGNGSLVGVFEFIKQTTFVGEIASSGMPEIYINLVLTTKKGPSSFSVQQVYPSGTPPIAVSQRTWDRLTLNTVVGDSAGVYLSESYGIFVPAGTYTVQGLVCASQGFNSVACLCLTSNTFSFSPASILLQSLSSVTECEFNGEVVIPDGGAGGSLLAVFGYGGTLFGRQTSSGLPELYINIRFTRKYPVMPPALQCTVQAVFPSGTNAPTFPRRVFNLVYLNSSMGSLSTTLNSNGTFYIPSGSYKVEGVNVGSGGNCQCQCFLAWCANEILFQPSNLLLQSQNSIEGDLHFDGTIQVPNVINSGANLALFVYTIDPIGYGASAESGLPDIFTNLFFTQLPPCTPCIC